MTTRLDDVPHTALFTDESHGLAQASPEQVWTVIESIGGDLGWWAPPTGRRPCG